MLIHLEVFNRTIRISYGKTTTDGSSPGGDGPTLDHNPPAVVAVEPLGFRALDDPILSAQLPR